MSHGGRREGAGRPALSPDTRPVTVTLRPKDLAYLGHINTNRFGAIRQIIQEHQELTAGGQDVIADPASPTGLWLAEWDGRDWVPRRDATGARIPAKLK